MEKITVKGVEEVKQTTEYRSLMGKKTSAIAEAEKFIIKTPEDVGVATERLSQVKTLIKNMKAKRDEWVKPIKEAVKNITDDFDKMIEPMEEVKEEYSKKMIAFNEEEEERIRKIEEKEQRKVDSGYQKETTRDRKVEEALDSAVGKRMDTESGHKATFVKTVDFEVEAIEKVPEEYLKPRVVDGTKVREALRNDPDLYIDGLKRVVKTTVRS